MCKRRRKGGPCPLPVQPEAGEQLTWHFQTRAEEAGATGLSQHIGGAGAKRLAQLVSRTGLSQRETRSGRRGCEPPNGDGGGGSKSERWLPAPPHSLPGSQPGYDPGGQGHQTNPHTPPTPTSRQPTNQQLFSTFHKCPTTGRQGHRCSPPLLPASIHTKELAAQEDTTKAWGLQSSKELGRVEE